MESESIYIYGFNVGYFVTKYKPELINQLFKTLSTCNEFFEGFFDGKAEVALEVEKLELLSLDMVRKKGKDLERDVTG